MMPPDVNVTYEERLAFVLPLIDIPDKHARDQLNVRWVKCNDCGNVAPESDFVIYGGSVHYNRGICKSCSRKNENLTSGSVSEEKKRVIFRVFGLNYDVIKRRRFKRRMWYSEEKGWHWLPVTNTVYDRPAQQ